MDENQQKWASKLMGYKFEIEYKPGVENKVVYGLSRHRDSSELYAFSIWQYNDKEEWDQEVQREPNWLLFFKIQFLHNNKMITTA